MALDATTTAQKTIDLRTSLEEEVHTAMEIVTSHETLGIAVDKIGVDVFMADGAPDVARRHEPGVVESWTSRIGTVLDAFNDAADDLLRSLRIRDHVPARELAIRRLEKNLTVKPTRLSNVFSLRYTARSPEFARRVLGALIESFRLQYGRSGTITGSVDFFEGHAGSLHKQLADTSERLRDLKNAHHIVDLPGRRENLLTAIRTIEGEILVSDHELESSNARIRELQKQISLPTTLLSVRHELEADLIRETVAVAAVRGRHEELQSQLADLHRSVRELNESEIAIAEHQRQITILEQQYLTAAQNLGQTRLAQALQEQGISSLKVIQTPTLNERPVSPQKQAAFAGGVLMGAVLALALVWILSRMESSLHDRFDVERRIEVPVVASLSPAKSRAPRRLVDDQFQRRLLQIQHANHTERKQVTIAVLNCNSASVAPDLARSIVRCTDHRVLLIDGDPIARRVGDAFRLNGEMGFSDIEWSGRDLASCILQTDDDRLSVIPAGTMYSVNRPVDLQRLRARLASEAADYPFVIVDFAAPSEQDFDLLGINSFDAIVVVVKSGRSTVASVRKLKSRLEGSGAKLMGAVVDGERVRVPQYLQRWLAP